MYFRAGKIFFFFNNSGIGNSNNPDAMFQIKMEILAGLVLAVGPLCAYGLGEGCQALKNIGPIHQQANRV